MLRLSTSVVEAFAERTRVELEATGEHSRERTVATRDELTPQEAQISRLTAHGATKPRDRGAAVHQREHGRVALRKAFRKLGVRSRTQVAEHVLQAVAPSGTLAREP